MLLSKFLFLSRRTIIALSCLLTASPTDYYNLPSGMLNIVFQSRFTVDLLWRLVALDVLLLFMVSMMAPCEEKSIIVLFPIVTLIFALFFLKKYLKNSKNCE